MADFILRKLVVQIEEIHHDGGPAPAQPRLRGAVLAVVKNPFAGRYEPELQGAMENLKPLGLQMTDHLIRAMGGRDGIDAYGKGAIVGAAGELEHGALWHVPGGYAMRERLGESRAIVPSSKKLGPMGASIDIPIGHINAAYVRGHFDAMSVAVPDGPKPDEIVFVLVMAKGPRIHSRMGGLEVAQVKGEDGLR
ncbi:amino acid synthesis family protein [Gemmobacter fulvus]|uniref:Amino acid synthesis family protein n=1 Tax=Gemmobacter fulvus TaxID=2840474 RepID=A0A975RZS1_9RHOB|nr:amino acid synthesis family protein [Gemmobacter fulvus]MBT9245787.1 amino acid synthesis family protein [Gemmobacter fulvus]QWK89374.1 amino acid synthesis family protein [Gemmobacter fulvus]